MQCFRTFPKLTMFVAASAVGMTACSDQQPSTGAENRASDVPLKLELSSSSAAPGKRVVVAVNLDVAPGTTGVVQGALEFDAARLSYVGQSPAGSAISMVNAKRAANGSLRLLAGLAGITGRVALLVFEAKGSNYASSLRYVPQMAASIGSSRRQLSTSVVGTSVDETLAVPSDASVMTLADWSARIVPEGSKNPAVAAAPGEYFLNLKYGDIDFNSAIDGNDFLAVANAAVGNDQIIIGTNEIANDRDLVIAGNVFPTNTAGACGTESDGTRVLDGNDFLSIANVAVGNAETCAGTLIPGRGPLATNRVQVSGNLTGTINWTKNNVYQLNGLVTVKDLATLNIQEGTRIEGNSAQNPSALFVERGGAIFAVGTQNEPVVFTCTAAIKAPGCWGGLWISGKSNVNSAAVPLPGGTTTIGQSPAFAARPGPQAPVPADAGGCNQQLAETGNAPTYGGCTPNDNSGRLSYVRVEFGGFVVAPNRELNNLTLAGVGSATQIDHIQAHGGSDDGVEFFGGTVNVSFALVTGNNDDGWDGSDGYNGSAQFVIIQNDLGDPSATADSRAIEMDNFGSSNTNLPRTNARMYNFTILGEQVNRSSTAAMMFRRGTGGVLANSIISGWPAGVSTRDANTCNTFGTGVPSVLSTTFMDVTTLGSPSDNTANNPVTCAPGTPQATNDAGEALFLSLQPGFRTRNLVGAATGIQQTLLDALNTTLPDFRMKFAPGGSAPIEGGVETVPAGLGLVQTNYRGAVGTLADGQIPWYSGWTRGFASQNTP